MPGRQIRIIPAVEIWYQTDGDLNEAFNLVRVRARVHTDVVPREALVIALEETLKRLKNDSSKLLIKEHDDKIVLA
jgi:hypothetical protein